MCGEPPGVSDATGLVTVHSHATTLPLLTRVVATAPAPQRHVSPVDGRDAVQVKDGLSSQASPRRERFFPSTSSSESDGELLVPAIGPDARPTADGERGRATGNGDKRKRLLDDSSEEEGEEEMDQGRSADAGKRGRKLFAAERPNWHTSGLRESFDIYIQFLCSTHIDEDFRSLLNQEPDPYFDRPIQQIERALSDRERYCVQSSVWGDQFTADLQHFPRLATMDARSEEVCQACHRQARKVTVLLQLSGRPYSRYDGFVITPAASSTDSAPRHDFGPAPAVSPRLVFVPSVAEGPRCWTCHAPHHHRAKEDVATLPLLLLHRPVTTSSRWFRAGPPGTNERLPLRPASPPPNGLLCMFEVRRRRLL